MEVPTAEPKTYDGNCHCGAFKFTVKLPSTPYTCNCSICRRNGYIWVEPIGDEDLIIYQGKGSLAAYEFGSKHMTHLFCPKCGSSVMARMRNPGPGRETRINIRMLKHSNEYFESIKHNNPPLPSAVADPQYKAPPFPLHLDAKNLTADERIYNGNCHCGAVTYAVKTKTLEEQKVMCCNCSICSRHGALWIYPSKSAVVIQGGENLTDYAYFGKNSLRSFCKTCGVLVLVKVTDEQEEDPVMPINVRTIDGIDIGSLKLKYYDGAKEDPQYEV